MSVAIGLGKTGRRFAAPALLRTQFRSIGFSVSAKVTSTISGTDHGTQSSFVRHSSLVAVVIMRLARAAMAAELLPDAAPLPPPSDPPPLPPPPQPASASIAA